MGCLDSVVSRLEEQRENWITEFREMFNSALSHNPILNDIVGFTSDISAQIVNQLFTSTETAVSNWLQETATSLVDAFTASDEIQIALFSRLSNTLDEYLTLRIETTDQVRTIVQNMLGILNEVAPRDDQEIVKIIKLARSEVQAAVSYLKAAERSLLQNPPVAFRSYPLQAGLRVEKAVDILGGDTQDIFNGVTFLDGYNQFMGGLRDAASDFEEQYRIAMLGLARGLRELSELLVVDIPGSYLVGALSSLHIPTFGANDNLAEISTKVKSTAQLLVAFPFHIATLNSLVQVELNRIRGLKENLNEIQLDMGNELDSMAVANGNYMSLYGLRVGWATELNFYSNLLGNERNSVFATLDEPLNNLIEDVTAIQTIIDYLAQPNYLRDINNRVEFLTRTCASMIPSLFGSVVSINSYNRARSYLYDMLVHANILTTQDTELRAKLRLLNINDNNNPVVQRALESLNRLEQRFGNHLSERWGINDGSVVARICSVMSPGIVSTIASPIFGGESAALSALVDDQGGGLFESTQNDFFGGLQNSLSSMISCQDATSNEHLLVHFSISPDTLPDPERNYADTEQSIQNSVLTQNMRSDKAVVYQVNYRQETNPTPILDNYSVEDTV